MAKQKSSRTKLKKKTYEITGHGCTMSGKPVDVGTKVKLTEEGYQFFKSKNWVK